jgi:putative transposase
MKRDLAIRALDMAVALRQPPVGCMHQTDRGAQYCSVNHQKRRVKAKLREDRQEAVRPNDVWAMDFVHDQLATGKKLHILAIVDTHSRFCPATDPRFTYRGEDVVQTLEKVCGQIGHPKTIRVDNVLCAE